MDHFQNLKSSSRVHSPPVTQISWKYEHNFWSYVLTDKQGRQQLCQKRYSPNQIHIGVRTIPVLGYWPILASIGWYWYRPNTFLSNRAKYWADNSLWRCLATHNDLISYAGRPPHCRSWESDTRGRSAGKVRVWNPIPTVNLSGVMSLHSQWCSNDWSCIC